MTSEQQRDSSESPPSYRELYREFRADGLPRLESGLAAVVAKDMLDTADLEWNPPDRDKWRDERRQA